MAYERVPKEAILRLVSDAIRIYVRPYAQKMGTDDKPLNTMVQQAICALRDEGFTPDFIVATPYMLGRILAGIHLNDAGDITAEDVGKVADGMYSGCDIAWMPPKELGCEHGIEELWVMDSMRVLSCHGAAVRLAEPCRRP